MFQLFDTCLAPDTTGDGTGCDNMTCVIVKFHDRPAVSPKTGKRPASETKEETGEEEGMDTSSSSSPVKQDKKRTRREEEDNVPEKSHTTDTASTQDKKPVESKESAGE